MVLVLVMLLSFSTAEVIFREGSNYIKPRNEGFILDGFVETCASFQANDSLNNLTPQYTTFRLQQDQVGDELHVTLIGENLTCREGLFVTCIRRAQIQDWKGIWLTCPLIGSQFPEICTFSCQHKDDCTQIQVSKRPRTRDQSSWSLCDLYLTPPTAVATGCDNIQIRENGIHRINLPYVGNEVLVFCDMTTDGGGWTVVLVRKDGSVNFAREWQDYKLGFGSLTGEFWAGNELMHRLTTDGRMYSLRVDLEDYDGNTLFAVYEYFVIGPESDNYRLNVGGYSTDSSAGDSLSYHDNMSFSTFEHDNDHNAGNCALRFGAPWWFSSCLKVLLTGKYGSGLDRAEGITWKNPLGYYKFAKFAKMMIRPQQ